MTFVLCLVILAAAFLMFYLQATSRIILWQELGLDEFPSVVSANRLDFSFVREALEELALRVDYPHSRIDLKSDLLAPTLLLKIAWKTRERLSKGERLLIQAGFVLLLIIVHTLR
jgi:hypothetical protein